MKHQYSDEHGNNTEVDEAGSVTLSEQDTRTLAHYHADQFSSNTALSGIEGAKRRVRNSETYNFTVTVPLALQSVFERELTAKAKNAKSDVTRTDDPSKLNVAMRVLKP